MNRVSTKLRGLRVLLVHAHPDDESILTGGTIATLLACGARVHNLTCTLGEEGEVIDQRWAGLVAAQADQLGGYRAAELTAALGELGFADYSFLGGAGTWRDSGMAGTPSQGHDRALTNPEPGRFDLQRRQLARAVRELRPHVVITYDPVGWYGHPDHIRAHELTHAALADAARAASEADADDSAQPEAEPTAASRRAAQGAAGEPWLVPRVAWVVTAASEIEADAQRQALGGAGPDAPPSPPQPLRPGVLGELPGWPDGEITHAVSLDAQAQWARARALARHATQVQVYPPLADSMAAEVPPSHFALSNHILQPLGQCEYFVAMSPTGKQPVWKPVLPALDPETLALPTRKTLPELWDGLEWSSDDTESAEPNQGDSCARFPKGDSR